MPKIPPPARNQASTRLTKLKVGRFLVALKRELSGFYYAAKRLGLSIRVRKVDEDQYEVWKVT